MKEQSEALLPLITNRVCFISDTHTKHEQLNINSWPDILIHSGDVTNVGSSNDVYNFLKWFGKQPVEHKVFIGGNHDFNLHTYMSEDWAKELAEEGNITFLHDSSVTIRGLKMWGSPWTTPFYNWAYMKTEDELRELYSEIPDDVNFLITHGPPHGIGDLVHEYNGDILNVGSKALRERVNILKPSMHVFGHIHSSNGKYKIDEYDTMFINASVLDEQYSVRYKPTLVEMVTIDES